LIATFEGLRAIEDLRVGDKVYSTDENGIGGAFAVRTLFTRQVDCVYDIKVDGTTITSSGEHPFWVMGCGWKLARELEPGDFLLTRTGLNWPVDGVECRSGDFKVYNFEIEEYHTYYVSSLEIFVHNMCGDGVGSRDADRITHGAIPNTFSFGRLQANEFVPPSITTNRHGQLTNGRFTLDETGMQVHLTGTLSQGKSQFFFRVNHQHLLLDAAAYADEAGLWVGSKAKIILDRAIGVHGRTGQPTNVINIYRNRNGFIHGAPGSPQ